MEKEKGVKMQSKTQNKSNWQYWLAVIFVLIAAAVLVGWKLTSDAKSDGIQQGQEQGAAQVAAELTATVDHLPTATRTIIPTWTSSPT